MKNLKISAKLSLSFILINVMYIIGIIALLLSYMMSNERLNNMNSEAVKPQMVIGEMREAILRERLEAERLVFLAPDSAQYTQTIQACETEHQEALDAISAFLGESLDESGKSIALEIQSYYNNEYSAFITELIRLSERADSAAAIALMSESQAVEDQMDGKLANAVTLLENNIDQIIYGAQFGLIRLFLIVAVVIVLIIFVVIYIIKYMQRTISRKIEALTETANLLAVGNLDIQISSDSTDEIGRLTESFLSIAKSIRDQTETLSAISEGDLTVDIAPRSDCDTMNLAIKKMIDNLNAMFAQISGSTVRVSSGAKQIADGSQSLAQGAVEQTSAVEQVSSAVAGMTQTTQDNFTMAKQAAELVGSVNSNAASGSEQMSNMAQAVQDISIASQAISKVMKTIDDIAFQTNILALNAAVEAARAGQHGKGFAVVADEVRSLASKSAEAANETGALIEDSMQKSELGTQIVQEAVKSFELIASGIHKSASLLTDIARLSEQQNSAIHQINENIDHVAQVAQQNSATAKESAASSDELSGQSEVLEGLISRFKIKPTDRSVNDTGAFSL